MSVASSGAQAARGAYEPAISARGRFVAFCSDSRDLVGGDSNGVFDVFVRDLRTGITTRRSLGTTGGQANADCWGPSISEDARRVVFTTQAALTRGDSNGRSDVFVNE